MQVQSRNDYLKGKKKAYSPPPGGSFHEAGRAIDIDLSAIKIPLSQFWVLAASFGLQPIIAKPNPKTSEAWHFDCMGSHALEYHYYQQGKGTNLKPYVAAAASATLAIGVEVDVFGSNQAQAAIQGSLIRLGKNIGNLDGILGAKSKKALQELGFTHRPLALEKIQLALDGLLREKFALEYE